VIIFSKSLTRLLFSILLASHLGFALVVAQTPARTPSDTVRQFYKAMREKRFREAFALSIYKSAIDGLKPEQFEDLRPDFDNMAAAIPDNVEINGEQVSGDTASVFVKVPGADGTEGQMEPVPLLLANGEWIVGDKENQADVKKAGNNFFFKARIDTHHQEATTMLQRISVAELIYAKQHAGLYGDLTALTGAGLVPKDAEGTESTGYRYRVNLGKDQKSFTVNAEPAQYGKTGLLSYFMDQSGIRSGDNGGKPLSVKSSQ
jgi:hypothetical protein